MKTVRLCSVLMLAVLLVGGYASAAPAPPSPEVIDLELVKVKTTTMLPNQVVEVIKSTSWALADVEQTFLAGRYSSIKENSLGTFYQAENYAFAKKYRRNQYHLLRGGFWLPKNGDFKPRLYFLDGGRPVIVDDISSLSPEAVKANATGNKPIMVQVSSAAGAAGVNIAGGLIAAIVESGYAKPQQEVMMAPVTNPELLKLLSEAITQLTPAIPPSAVTVNPATAQ